MASKKMLAPRGIRNNNPGNIRWDGRTQWQGQIGADKDGFIIFSSMAYGIRAMSKVLDSYARRGLTTIGQIIPTWAPAVENDVESYVRSVEQQTGLSRSEFVPPEKRPDLIAAIIRHENGKALGEAIIAYGIALA